MAPPDDRTRMWQLAARTSAVGMELLSCLGIGAGAGYWLDGRFGWAPYGLLGGFVVGLGAAAVSLRRVVLDSRGTAPRA